MAQFPKPSDIETAYFQILKSIKPSLNLNDKNSDFVIRGKALAGIVSGLYGDQAKVNNDTYIQSARPESLVLRGDDLGIDPQPSTPARTPQARVTGTVGAVINVGTTLRYIPTGVLYSTTTAGTVGGGGTVDVGVQCNTNGQIGNVLAGDTLEILSPPSGIDPGVSLIQALADGSDVESTDSYRQRLLDRFQRPPAGGNQFDYPNFAFKADPSVRSALIKRFGRGLGTVDVYITTGTTDIDTAVTNGLSIVRIPSSITLAAVQVYYDQNVPLTDCPKIFAPTEVPIDVTVKVVLAAGLTLSSVPSDPVVNPLGLTVQQLIQREVARVLYKVPVGGRKIPGFTNGFVVASDIEENLDVYLSAFVDSVTNLAVGKLPVLADRQVQPLDSPNTNKAILANQLALPGTITVVLGT